MANQYGFVAKQVLFEKDQCVLVTKQGLFAPEQSRSVMEITVFVREIGFSATEFFFHLEI